MQGREEEWFSTRCNLFTHTLAAIDGRSGISASSKASCSLRSITGIGFELIFTINPHVSNPTPIHTLLQTAAKLEPQATSRAECRKSCAFLIMIVLCSEK
jgi:hypothetical protein